jgi:hypothetical protein
MLSGTGNLCYRAWNNTKATACTFFQGTSINKSICPSAALLLVEHVMPGAFSSSATTADYEKTIEVYSRSGLSLPLH